MTPLSRHLSNTEKLTPPKGSMLSTPVLIHFFPVFDGF